MTVAIETPRPWRWSVKEYERLYKKGVLGHEARTELIRGEIIRMSPIGLPQAVVVNRMTRHFTERLGRRAVVQIQGPMPLDNWSLPQPDVVLFAPRDDFYASAGPTPADVLLAVEVSYSTLSYDRGVKLPLYAEFGIPEVWIAAFARSRWHLEAYREPEAGVYRSVTVLRHGETVSPLAFGDVVLAVEDLLGAEG